MNEQLFDGVQRVLLEHDLSWDLPYLRAMQMTMAIDRNPVKDCYILTTDPATLAKLWPPYFPGGYIPEAGSMNQEGPRPNVLIGVHVTTQAEADRLIPELLPLRNLCRGLWVDLRGQTEEIDLEKVPLPDAYLKMNGITGVLQPLTEKTTEPDDYRYHQRLGFKIHFVTIGGIDKPVHPQWLRTIRDQCKAADVPVWFDGWGEWGPMNVGAGGDIIYHVDATECGFFDYCNRFNTNVFGSAVSGGNPFRQSMAKVGSTRSGHLLDGVELRQTMEGE